jgi:hypothetical protein
VKGHPLVPVPARGVKSDYGYRGSGATMETPPHDPGASSVSECVEEEASLKKSAAVPFYEDVSVSYFRGQPGGVSPYFLGLAFLFPFTEK